MEQLKKFIQLPLKHKIVSIVILIVIVIASAFGTTACSFKASELQLETNPNQYFKGELVNE